MAYLQLSPGGVVGTARLWNVPFRATEAACACVCVCVCGGGVIRQWHMWTDNTKDLLF